MLVPAAFDLAQLWDAVIWELVFHPPETHSMEVTPVLAPLCSPGAQQSPISMAMKRGWGPHSTPCSTGGLPKGSTSTPSYGNMHLKYYWNIN